MSELSEYIMVIRAAKKEIDRLNKRIAELEQDRDGWIRNFEIQEKVVEIAQQRVAELEQQLADERHDCADLALQVAKLEQQLAEARESIAKQIEAKDKACAALMNQLAEWHNVFGHLSKDADTAGNMINEGIAERDAEIERLKHYCEKCMYIKEYQKENAALRAEMERLKEESSHLWVRIESGEAAAYEQGKAEARQEAAQEIIEDVIGDWNCDCGYGGLVIADAIKAKFGLEG